MSTKKNISILVGIIGLLILLLSGSIGYIIANENNKGNLETGNTVDNSKVLKEIEELKTLYDSKISDKTNNYISLQIQKDSIENLVLALENSKSNANALVKYKTEYKNLESKMKILVSEIVVLRSKKTSAISEKSVAILENSSKSTLEQNVIKPEIIVAKKENVAVKTEAISVKSEIILPKTVVVNEEKPTIKLENSSKKYDRNAKITLSDVKAAAFISKSSTKKVVTTDASRADLIKISFIIDGNPDVIEGEKTYYFEILNNNNNVMGKRITEYFDNEALTYSFSKSFSYGNQSILVAQEFLSSTFEKGYYFINIFDRDQLVGKTSLLLK